MAGGFTTVGQVLQLIGQAPVKHGRSTAIEKLRAAKSTFPMFGMDGKMPAQMQELLQGVMENGPQSLMQNPIGMLTGQLQGQMDGLMGKLNSVIGGGGIAALIGGAGGLQATVGKLMSHVGGMVGLPGGTAGFDLNSIIGHAGLTSLGVPVPIEMSLERVLAPALSHPMLQDIQATLYLIENDVDNGWDPSGFAAAVMGHTFDINTLIEQSNTALALGLQSTLNVSAFSIIAEGLDPSSTPPGPLADFFQSAVHPGAKAAIAEHHATLEAQFAAMRARPEPDPALDVSEHQEDA